MELEDILSGGPERRVDNHRLVLYLSQVRGELHEVHTRIDAYLEAEKERREKLDEVIDLLTGMKGALRVVKYLASIAAGVGLIFGGLKRFFH